MNPTDRDLVVRLSLAGISVLVDALEPAGGPGGGRGGYRPRVARDRGAFEVAVPARTVRIMTVES